jgi:hypothetical protein
MPCRQTGWRKFVTELLAAYFAHQLRTAERIARCGLAAIE